MVILHQYWYLFITLLILIEIFSLDEEGQLGYMVNNHKIAIVDDHPILSDGLKAILTNHGYSDVETFNSEEDINIKFEASDYKIIILDINLGKIDGLELLSKIKHQNSSLHVIILTSYTDARLIKKAIQQGASGYISKQIAAEHILEAIEHVCQGKKYYDPLIQDIINSTFSNTQPMFDPSQERENYNMLSDREKQVLRLIAAEFSSEEIGKELFISKGTVDTYRKKLIEKLKAKNSVGLGVFYHKLTDHK